MRKFIKNISVALLLPLLMFFFFTLQYISHDVHYDFGTYKNYSWKYFFQSLGDLSTKKLLNTKQDYNTFIFGSSRTTSLYACYLQRKIKNSKAFHYGNWNESIGGIYAKIRLLDSLGYDLENIFIYFDTDFTFKDDGSCKPYDHYLLTNKNKSAYYLHHYQGYFSGLSFNNLKILLGLKANKESFPDWESDINTNDCNHQCSDSIISRYGETHFTKEYQHQIDSLKSIGFLYDRPRVQEYKEAQISGSEAEMLQKIRDILNRHQANFYIIITPLYDQLKFSESDMKVLRSTFGNHLHDFSGINRFTQDAMNYPDKMHFLPYISKKMVDSVLAIHSL